MTILHSPHVSVKRQTKKDSPSPSKQSPAKPVRLSRDFESLKARCAGKAFDIARQTVGLTESKNPRDREHHQPCPVCQGGDDRFYFRPKEETFHCRQCSFTGGDVIALVAAARNVTPAEAYDIVALAVDGYVSTADSSTRKTTKTRRTNERHTKHVYTDEDGKMKYWIERTDYINEKGEPAKDCIPKHLSSTGAIIAKEPGVLYPYRLPDALKADTVFIVEGEKVADTLHKVLQSAGNHTAAATTSQGGSNRGYLWKEFLQRYPALANKSVRLLPDNDEGGRKFMLTVADAFLKANPAADVKIIELPNLPEKGDFHDLYHADGKPHCKGKAVTIHDWLFVESDLAPPVTLDVLSQSKQSDASGKKKYVLRTHLIDVSKIDIKPIDWLWYNKVTFGDITLLVGDPKVGKSMLTAYMTSVITRGYKWNDGTQCELGSVLFFAGEDRPDDYARRLHANGADPTKIRILEKAVLESDGSAGQDEDAIELEIILKNLDIVEDAIDRAAKETGVPVKMVVIDPVANYWGNIRENNNADVRSALHPLQQFFQKRRIAPVLIQHLKKTGECRALDRVIGSRGITGVARSIWGVFVDPEDTALKDTEKKRLFVPYPSNVCIDPVGFSYRIAPPDGRVEIVDGEVYKDADDCEADWERAIKNRAGRKPDKRNDCADWLEEILADGAKLSTEIFEEGEEAGFAPATINRAKKALGIKSIRDSKNEPFRWILPPKNEEFFTPENEG